MEALERLIGHRVAKRVDEDLRVENVLTIRTSHRSGSGWRDLNSQHRSRAIDELALKHRKIECPFNRFGRRRGTERPFRGP